MSESNDRLCFQAYVTPFVVFMGFLLVLQFVEPILKWEHPDAPWWRYNPAFWFYPLQSLVCFVIVWRYRHVVTWQWSAKSCLYGVLFGIVGIGCWLLPLWIYRHCYVGTEVPMWWKCLGVDAREKGFNPGEIFGVYGGAWWFSLIGRFFRAVVVVALVEELFWRGFLMRFIQNRDKPFSVPFGMHSWLAYAGTTLAFMLVHSPIDYAAAFVYGSLTYLLAVTSKSLSSCVVMHAVANAILGGVAVYYGAYGLW